MTMGSHGVPAAESFQASGRSAEKLSLPSLQSKMKCDPEGYEAELLLLRNQFNSSLELFQQQAAMNFTSISGIGSDTIVAKDLADRATFLAHVTLFYPKHLAEFPSKLADLLRCAARTLPSGLRCDLTKALILLVNRNVVDLGETLSLFMELQTLGDKQLKKLAFDHVVHSIKRMNQKHKNEAKNRALQNVLFSMLQQEDEKRAMRALLTLRELHKRQVWFDERTANAICFASFHPASRIMIATLSFLLDYEKIENYGDSDDSSSEDEAAESPQVSISRQSIYKASHQGTTASKKRKKAKLQRVMRNMKKKQRLSSDTSTNNHYSPLNHLRDAQGFAEKLFSRLQKCDERFESKWIIAALFGCLILWRHDAEALWFATGSILNTLLYVSLKRILNQERPSTLKSDPGMPSSHAQSIFFTVFFIILTSVEWFGLNGFTIVTSGLALAFGSFFSYLRVSQQLHTISQVVVGAIIGSAFTFLWYWLWNAFVLDAFASYLWVRIIVVLGSAGFCLGFVIYAVLHWLKDD